MSMRYPFRRWMSSLFGTKSKKQPRLARDGSRRRPNLESLESRIAPAGSLSFAGTTLTFTAAATDTNNLTISFSGGQYTFTDTTATITAGAGTTQNGPNSAVSDAGDTINTVMVTLSNNAGVVIVNSTGADTIIFGNGGSDTFNTATGAVPAGATLTLTENGFTGTSQYNIDAQGNPFTETLAAASPFVMEQGSGDGPIVISPGNGFGYSVFNVPTAGITEHIALGGPNSTGFTQTLTVSSPSAGQTKFDLDGGFVTSSFPTADYASISVQQPSSNTDSDQVTVDYSGGNPLPSTGLNYIGGAGASNTLTATGYNVGTVTSTYTGAHSGTVQVGAGARPSPTRTSPP